MSCERCKRLEKTREHMHDLVERTLSSRAKCADDCNAAWREVKELTALVEDLRRQLAEARVHRP